MTWWNITQIQADIFSMFLTLFGSTELVFAFVLCFFAYLCIIGNLKVEEASIVFIPLVWGIVEDGWLPIWVKAMFVLAIAVTWFMAFLRVIREG